MSGIGRKHPLFQTRNLVCERSVCGASAPKIGHRGGGMAINTGKTIERQRKTRHKA